MKPVRILAVALLLSPTLPAHAAEEPPPDPEDQGAWENTRHRVSRETYRYFEDLRADAPGQQPYQKIEAMMPAVDRAPLKELGKAEKGR